MVGCLFKLITGKPVIIKTRNVGRHVRESDFSLTNKIRMKFLNTFIDCFVAINKEIENNLIKMEVNETKIDLIPNGTDIVNVNSRRTKKIDLKNINILFVGRLIAHKRVDIILRLVHHFRNSSLNIKASLVGDGPDKDRLKELAYKLNIIENIKFLGYKSSPDTFEEMINHDLLVHPSAMEGFSNSIAESMSIGLPVISSNVGAAPDIIKNGENGFIFYSFEDLLDIFHNISNDMYSLSDISKYSIKTAKQIFDIKVVAKKYQIIYNNILH